MSQNIQIIGQNEPIELAQQENYKLGDQFNISIGLDLAQSIDFNSTYGVGDGKMNLGIQLEASYVKYFYKLLWENKINFDYGIQRQGTRRRPFDSQNTYVFLKSNDEFNFSSHLSLKPNYLSKLSMAFDYYAYTQLTPTYQNNFIKPYNNDYLTSGFLTPLKQGLSFGLDYKNTNKNIDIFVSPLSLKHTHVKDDFLASIIRLDENGKVIGSLFGNKIVINDDFSSTVKANRFELGTLIRINSKGLPYSKRLVWKSDLELFFTYTGELSLDINFDNRLEFALMEQLSISLAIDFYYDIDEYIYDPFVLQGNGSDEGTYYNKKLAISERLLFNLNWKFD